MEKGESEGWYYEALATLHQHNLTDEHTSAAIQDSSQSLYDVVIIYHEDDKHDATIFRDHLINDIIFDDKKRIKAALYDDISDPVGELSKSDLVLKISSFIFMFLTEKFVNDETKTREREEFLVKTLHNPEKRWSVIPVLNEPRRSMRYKLPVGLNSLKGLNYWANDLFYRENLRRLLRDKIAMREQRERLHQLLSENGNSKDKPVEQNRREGNGGSTGQLDVFSNCSDTRSTKCQPVSSHHLHQQDSVFSHETQQLLHDNKQVQTEQPQCRVHTVSSQNTCTDLTSLSKNQNCEFSENTHLTVFSERKMEQLNQPKPVDICSTFVRHKNLESQTFATPTVNCSTQPILSNPPQLQRELPIPSNAYSIRGPPSDFHDDQKNLLRTCGSNCCLENDCMYASATKCTELLTFSHTGCNAKPNICMHERPDLLLETQPDCQFRDMGIKGKSTISGQQITFPFNVLREIEDTSRTDGNYMAYPQGIQNVFHDQSKESNAWSWKLESSDLIDDCGELCTLVF